MLRRACVGGFGDKLPFEAPMHCVLIPPGTADTFTGCRGNMWGEACQR